MNHQWGNQQHGGGGHFGGSNGPPHGGFHGGAPRGPPMRTAGRAPMRGPPMPAMRGAPGKIVLFIGDNVVLMLVCAMLRAVE